MLRPHAHSALQCTAFFLISAPRQQMRRQPASGIYIGQRRPARLGVVCGLANESEDRHDGSHGHVFVHDVARNGGDREECPVLLAGAVEKLQVSGNNPNANNGETIAKLYIPVRSNKREHIAKP